MMTHTQHTTMTQSERSHSSATGDNKDITQRIAEHEKLQLRTFQYTDHNLLDLEHDIDPDNNPTSTTIVAITRLNSTTRPLKRTANCQSSISIAEVCMQTSITSRNI